jgi:hypothetical protein
LPLFALFFCLQFWTSDENMNGYAVGAGVANLFIRWIDLIVLHRPEVDFWSIEKSKKSQDHRDGGGIPLDAWPRIKWFGTLWIASRYACP